MENLEPKTRMEYFLNNIAEAVSGEGGGSIDMSSLILDPTEFQPLVMDGREWDFVWVSNGEGGKVKTSKPFIYDFPNGYPPIMKFESNEFGVLSYSVIEYTYQQFDPYVGELKGGAKIVVDEPYLAESTSAIRVNDNGNYSTVFPSTAKFELKMPGQ